ncbi:MAG: glycerol-3-phosphate 1-O-acyltransferase PlsY [Candidatus Omnitrophica bacterium]|nr:glycerol-3-phosphate 1-O-acyltransferase PlsY [Candidatus Omnitrophota bacterium]
MLQTFIALLASYLLGSIPTAYIFGRRLLGIDIRKSGSGNVGATNALRVLGKGPGIAVLIIDIFKGLIVVSFLGDYFADKAILGQVQNLRIIMGLCCICGHNWTVFLQFKGGKGIATSLGVLLGLALRITGLNIVIALLVIAWFIVFFLSRMVSLASIIAALALPALCLIFKQSNFMILVATLLCVFVIIRHKANLARILAGREPRLYFKSPK